MILKRDSGIHSTKGLVPALGPQMLLNKGRERARLKWEASVGRAWW